MGSVLGVWGVEFRALGLGVGGRVESVNPRKASAAAGASRHSEQIR